MWVRRPAVLCIFLVLLDISPVYCHLPNYVTTPSNKVEQYCMQSETCIHDTIPICGKMDDQTRTFLDLCDMLEYACDTNRIYLHVDDMPGCPLIKEKD